MFLRISFSLFLGTICSFSSFVILIVNFLNLVLDPKKKLIIRHNVVFGNLDSRHDNLQRQPIRHRHCNVHLRLRINPECTGMLVVLEKVEVEVVDGGQERFERCWQIGIGES